jgi:hypothetical protein
MNHLALLKRFRAASVVLALSLAACGGGSARQRVLLAPAVDLAPHSRIGLVTFSAQGAKGSLSALATQRFGEHLLRAQPGIEILELGVVEGPMDAALARKLGAEHGVRTVIVGNLVVSDIKPRVRILGGIGASAEVTISLATRLLATESGSTLWSQSSRLRETLGAVSILDGGTAVFDSKDPEEAYGEMVDRLVWNLTQDFRSTYVNR